MIDDPSVDTLIPLRREDPTRLTQFVHEIRLRPRLGQFVFAQPGDSGALVLTKADNLAEGLLFACPDNGSYAQHPQRRLHLGCVSLARRQS